MYYIGVQLLENDQVWYEITLGGQGLSLKLSLEWKHVTNIANFEDMLWPVLDDILDLIAS